jgi:hypothetical protein
MKGFVVGTLFGLIAGCGITALGVRHTAMQRLVDDWAVVRHPTHIRIMQQQVENCVAALERAIDANPNTQMPPSQPLPPGWGRGAEPRR